MKEIKTSVFRSDLKVQSAAQLKYVTDEDLVQLGMSKPEQRRLKKFYNKHFPQNYLSKFKKLLTVKKDDGLHMSGNINIGLYGECILSYFITIFQIYTITYLIFFIQ